MEWLILAGLGGLLGLDETSIGQTMVSRPMVAASIVGFLLGSPATGFLLGVFLECLYVSQLHVGGSRVPDGASAAVVGASVAALEPSPGGLALGLVVALLVGEVGGRVIVAFRRWCGRVVPVRPDTAIPPGHLGRLHLTLASVDFARGSAVTAAGLITVPLWIRLAGSWPIPGGPTLGILGVAAAVSLGVLWGAGSASRARLVLLGGGLLFSLAIGTA